MDDADEVRARSDEGINHRIDLEIAARVRDYELRTPAEITQRLRELDREWDVQRVIATFGSTLALAGFVLGLTRRRRWLILPTVALPMLVQHAVQGWCPPITLLRRLGIRTRSEIDREKYALKVLRGDFDRDELLPRAEAALICATT